MTAIVSIFIEKKNVQIGFHEREAMWSMKQERLDNSFHRQIQPVQMR